MTANDMHEITFFWPRTDANYVVVTGTFDNWSKSIRLEKGSTGFSTSVNVPWNTTVAYKYIVDGRWTLDDSKPRMVEPEGYINNVYVVPSKPSKSAAAETEEQVSGELEQNGHATLDKPLQGHSFGQKIAVQDSTIAEAIMSVPVDRQQADGESAVMTDQHVPSRAENVTVPSDPLSTKSSVQGETGESSQQVDQAASTKTTREVSQVATPRSIHLPLVPVNVSSEGATNASVVADETASTHNPLGPVNKSARSPDTSYVHALPEGESAPTEPEPKIPVTTYIPPVGGPGAGTSAGPESKPAEGEMPAEGGKDSNLGEGAKALQEIVPPSQKPASTQPAGENKPAESVVVVLPKHPNGSTASGTLASRSSNATSSEAATFPRASRESTDSRSSKSQSKGSPRKKKSSLLQKIKHIFSHDKSKK